MPFGDRLARPVIRVGATLFLKDQQVLGCHREVVSVIAVGEVIEVPEGIMVDLQSLGNGSLTWAGQS